MLTNNNSGFSLIELIAVIVVLAVLATVAIQSLPQSIEEARQIGTEKEMDVLARGIVGRFEISQGANRSNFGYIGDVGSFPPNLEALFINPGRMISWDGPYLPASFKGDSLNFRLDEWGQPYKYDGGLTIVSSGSKTDIIRKLADSKTDYILNSFSGRITDGADLSPGMIFPDSIEISIQVPDGRGYYLNKSYAPDATGLFRLDSLPVGTHPLWIIYKPTADSLIRYVTIMPRNKSTKTFKFAAAYFTP